MEKEPQRPALSPEGTPPHPCEAGDDADIHLVPDQSKASESASGDDWSALASTRVLEAPLGSDAEMPLARSGSDAEMPVKGPKSDAEVPAPAATGSPAEGKKRGKTTDILDDYRLLMKLGEGAMGVVYKARQISVPRDVALKVLFKHIATNPKLVERLYREARVSGSLDHPNIVQGYGVGEARGWHYFAMEYIDGLSLQKWLTHLGRLSVGDALHIAICCARALSYAHDREIIHRDIKPDNILITRQGVPKLADLGMVKMLDEDMSLTQTGHAVGTPWYMPLEQARNAKDTDGRCDIYALGCVLYQMLTGVPPFHGRTIVEVIQAKEHGTFPPARHFNPDVPERLDLFIAKMAHKQARYRHARGVEVIEDLESLGLSNRALEFMMPQGRAQTATGAGATDGTATPRAPQTPVPAGLQEDVWYARYKTPRGEVVTRKLTTPGVLELIADENFDAATQASRNAKEGFRALATYREFESHVLGRVSKTAADQQTTRYRALYRKIEEQERKREEKKQQAEEASTARYWFGIGVRVAAVVGVIVGICLLVRLIFDSFRGIFW